MSKLSKIIIIVETILLTFFSIAFFELSQDNSCKCYYPPQGIATYTEECAEEVFEEKMDSPTAITFGDPPATISWSDGRIRYEGNFDENMKQFLAVLRDHFEFECPCGADMKFSPEGKPSNLYNEIENKCVECWSEGYEVGYSDRPSDEEVCGALINYVYERPYPYGGTPSGINRASYESGYGKGYGVGWNIGFGECEEICEELLDDGIRYETMQEAIDSITNADANNSYVIKIVER